LTETAPAAFVTASRSLAGTMFAPLSLRLMLAVNLILERILPRAFSAPLLDPIVLASCPSL
jgi:hypothetical protein